MTRMDIIVWAGVIAGIVLPFWNIPLIVRIGRRKCSDDVSLWWAFGVWVCLLIMLPAGLVTEDLTFKAFSIVNFILFSALVVQIVRFRGKRD